MHRPRVGSQPVQPWANHSQGSAGAARTPLCLDLDRQDGAGWVRGLKACPAVMSASPPSRPPAAGNRLRSPPQAPSDSHRLHIWGKTPSRSILPGLPEFPACLRAAGRAGLAVGTGGEAFYGQDHEGSLGRVPARRAGDLGRVRRVGRGRREAGSPVSEVCRGQTSALEGDRN